jgi:methylated-DNA-[protein]-cysteine S-methyltransferase
VRIDLNVSPPSEIQNVSLFENVFTQFSEYFASAREDFTLPFCLNGSAFEKCVWEVLMQIPYGETHSYGEIAVACGNRKAARAVGQAVHRNPLPIIIPCHRVVGASNLGGYAGGVSIKRFLLWLEGVYKEKERFFR